MNPELLSRNEAWRRMYRSNRYCRHLTQIELNQRLRDIVVNMLRLTSDGKTNLPPIESEGIRNMELWTHALEEMALRHGPYPNGFTREIFRDEPLPDFAGELGQKAATALSTNGLQLSDVFIKFGKAKYMRALFERGAMRVQSASYYATSNHNDAIRDDELSLPLMSLSLTREDIVKLVRNPLDVPARIFDQRVDVTVRTESDYWLYCVTTAIEPRLFVDFHADSCVIIKDRERFQRLVTVQTTRYFPKTSHRHGETTYIDSLLPSAAVADVPMSKHFRYRYQKEYRFVWMPAQTTIELPYIDLELGNLKDIAELIVI